MTYMTKNSQNLKTKTVLESVSRLEQDGNNKFDKNVTYGPKNPSIIGFVWYTVKQIL